MGTVQGMTEDLAASRARHPLPEEQVPSSTPAVPAEEQARAILEESEVRTDLPVPDEQRTSADSA